MCICRWQRCRWAHVPLVLPCWDPPAGTASCSCSKCYKPCASVQVLAKCKASLFAYPAPVTEEATTTVSRLPTAVLSTTVKAKERAQRRQAIPHTLLCHAVPCLAEPGA